MSETTKPDHKDIPPDTLVYSRQQLNQTLSNLLYDAWRTRGSESYLYPFYNHILSINCANLRCAEYPRLTIAASPQPLFGPTPPPEGVRPTLSKNDLKFLPKKQFPDFARMAVYSDTRGELPPGIATARDLVDSWEIKPLKCKELWWTATAKQSAMKKLRACMDQVYEAAMAGFAHNPDWKRVYALLVVGPYFTHIAWTSRPADDILVPTKKLHIPAKLSELQKKTYGDRIEDLLVNIQQYKARKLPDQVFFYNDCVVDYPSKTQESQEAYQDVSLTPRFLWALACPIKRHFPKVADTCQMFAPPSTKPPISAGQRTSALKMIQDTMIGDHVARIESQLASLGYVQGASSSSPPNSKDSSGTYVPSGAPDSAVLSQLPPLTRLARSETHQELLPGID